MQVLTSTRQMAVFQIVRDLVTDISAIELDEFIAHWATTGLRQSDCPIAIAEMVRCRLFTYTQSGSHTWLELTATGLDEYHAADESLIRQVNDGLILLRAKWRNDWLSRSSTRHRRSRLEDQSNHETQLLH